MPECSSYNEGYRTMSGHGIIAVTRIAMDRGLVMSGDADAIVFDTPAGLVRATAAGERASFVNVPSYVLHAGIPVQLGPRMLRAAIAYGRGVYALVGPGSARGAVVLAP